MPAQKRKEPERELHLHLRAETKKSERRTALTPTAVKQLLAAGYTVSVERSTDNIFSVADYEQVGATIVKAGSWRQAAPETIIVGLKELPENDTTPLPHTHIMFAHCFKNQAGWRDVLKRFGDGKGTLLDLEFLQDDKGRRVAAFGYYAGYAGAAMGIDLWAHNQLFPGTRYPSMTPYNNEDELNAYVKSRLALAVTKYGKMPKVMVMGALGRCGSGSCDLARRVGIPEENIIKWDMAETAAGGPFPQILENEIFVNCIYLSSKIPPFLTLDLIQGASPSTRRLSVLVDVSCDTTNPNNPVPVYTRCTTFDDPVETVPIKSSAQPLHVISIDHLPTMLPREASEFFCRDLMPSLLQLKDRATAPVWANAEKLFLDKLEESKKVK